MKKLLLIGTLALTLMATSVSAFAATYKTPAEILSGLTNKSVETVYSERQQGKTFGVQAIEAGVFDEFQSQMLENRKALLQERVNTGAITQAQADAAIKQMEQNQSICDGSGIGAGTCGLGMGLGNGAGFGNGAGMRGAGFGLRR